MATLDIVQQRHRLMLKALKDSELYPRTEENDREFHLARNEWQAACVSFRELIKVQKGGLELNPPDIVTVMKNGQSFMTIHGPSHIDYKLFEGMVLKRVMHVKAGDNRIREKDVWYTVEKGELIDMTKLSELQNAAHRREFFKHTPDPDRPKAMC